MIEKNRLTAKNEKGDCICIDCINGGDCGYCSKMDDILQKLCELEDKIEHGTLIELPCKVGDTVCKYYKVENGIKIYSGTVTKIEMRKNGIMIYITTLPNFYYDKAFIGDLNKAFIDTTCYYFCPVKEAEKRLKELRE